MRRDNERAHVDFEGPLKAYAKATVKGARVTVAPDDGLSHPASGNPCSQCRWEEKPVEDELGQRVVDQLEIFNRFMRVYGELKAIMTSELLGLADEAARAGRADIVNALKSGARSGEQ